MKWKIVENGIEKWANDVLLKSQPTSIRTWLNRRAYPMILNFQLKRFQTENVSQGTKWAPLKTKKYADWKKRKFADYPGGGRKLLIATGELSRSLTGKSWENHLKLVEENRLVVGTLLPYAKFLDQGTKNMPARDLSSLNEPSWDILIKDLVTYLMGN